MNFDEALAHVLKHEGGYVDHPADPGGATNMGITERVARKHGYTGHMRDLPMSMVRYIYHTDYWKPCRCDDLPEACRFDVFDAAVNSGVYRSAMWLQEVIEVAADGKIGPITIAAAQAMDDNKLSRLLIAKRLRFMTQLSHWQTFGRGWARRIADNLEVTE